MEIQEETTTTNSNSNNNAGSSKSGESTTENANRPAMPERNCDDEGNCERPELPMSDCKEGDEDCELLLPDCSDEEENCEIPTPPSGAGPMGGGGFPGEMTTGVPPQSDSILHPVAYLSLGTGSLILAMVICYAGFSRFFKKKPGETFATGARFVWYCVASIGLTAGLITLCYFVPIWVR